MTKSEIAALMIRCPEANALFAELNRLRGLLAAYHIDQDRCDKFPGGEQCGRKAGHEGKCVWLRGD